VTDAPDLAAPVAGWRVWFVGEDADGPSLVSPVAATVWPPRRATTASCRTGCPDPPSWSCACGLYATAHLDRLRPMFGLGTVLGCTALWGRVVEATDGWRAEHGYPLALLAPHATEARPVTSSLRAKLRMIAQRRDVPGLVAPDTATMGALAGRYAVPVRRLPAPLPIRGWPSVARCAGSVRDEAATGVAARRLGDEDAQLRFARALDDLLAAVAFGDGYAGTSPR
jgi:hypothetical protein